MRRYDSKSMNALEEILEEVKAVGNIQFSSYTDLLIPVKDVEKIIRSHMNSATDTNVDCKWIPVSERLPEEDQCILVTVNGRYKNVTFDNAIQLACYYEEEGWVIEEWPEWENPNVIAWMELPEPYKPVGGRLIWKN